MTRWRNRLGEAEAETMLKATIEAGVAMKVIATAQISHVNVDKTVQIKAIRYPTKSRLYDRARELLVAHDRKAGVKVKQIYERVGKYLVMKFGLYAHARQSKRAQACTRKLRTNLGRVIREVERQGEVASLSRLLSVCKRIHAQNLGISIRFIVPMSPW